MALETFQPMLSGKYDPSLIFWPKLASPKLDGIRALCVNGTLVSRKLKPIRNRHVQRLFGGPENNGLDGELVYGNFQSSTSAVMSEWGEFDVKWQVFDNFLSPLPFVLRWDEVFNRQHTSPSILPVPHQVVNNEEELLSYELACLQAGFEGVMLRDPQGPYKHGRSTTLEGWLLKVKRFEDAEAVVVGWEEKLHNANEAQTDLLGYTKRSQVAENKLPTNTLGSLILEVDGVEGANFSVGTGFDDFQRADLWQRREALLGKVVKYKYQPTGVKNKPRFPVFLGFRED